MLCSRCGHENPEENRYCGMCGSRLDPAPAPKDEGSQSGSNERIEPAIGSIFGLNSALHPGDVGRPEQPISGPSFLGLNSAPESSGTSYLFEDEPPRGHAGLWITLVLLAVLALAGFQLRTQVRARAGQVYAAVMQRVNSQPAPPASAAMPSTVSPGAPSSESSPAASPSSEDWLKESQPTSPAAAPNTDTQQPPTTKDPPEGKVDKTAGKSATAEKAPEPPNPEVEPAEAPATPARATRKAVARHANPVPEEVASPEDTRLLQLAQRYIHGQGVRRDCQQGLVYLREAMKHPNAPAASQMGALYATGTCLPLDRVAAYRWFSSALQMAPSNAWLARERDQLYAQMSSSERRRADRQ